MHVIPAGRLKEIGEAIFVAEGATPAEAETVMRHLVEASLVGHDSHGIIAIPKYVERIRKGHIKPGARMEIERETPATLVVNGNWGFGFVVTEAVTKALIEKTAKNGVAAATIYQQSHIGRLGGYTMMAAQAGMIGLICADSGRGPKSVVPFGGSEPRLGTNPLSVAVPSDLSGPFFFDMATSAVASGKVSLALARGQSIPTGWVVDNDGNDVTDPAQFKGNGWLMPLGGTEGHKGYALAATVEVLCGLLTGLGFGVSPTGIHNDGVFMAVFNVEMFRPLDTFKKEVAEFAAYLKDTKPSKGSRGVYYPGEIESITRAERAANGIKVEEKTWTKITGLAQELGLAGKLGL